MTERPVSPQQSKDAVRQQWDQAAAGWNKRLPQIRAWLAEATEAMLDLASIEPGARVLDVAAGAGDQTCDIARRVGSGGSVLATDVSPQMLALAAENAGKAGLSNIEIKVTDAENLELEEASFDAAVCRLGLMLFSEPLRSLHGIHRALKPGGRFCAMVFSEPQNNPCSVVVFSTALKHAGMTRDPNEPGGLFSLSKPGLIEKLFRAANFGEVTVTRISAPIRLPSVQDYMGFIRNSAGPIIQILSKLNEEGRNAAWAEMADKLVVFQTPTHWEAPSELLLVAGSR